MSMGKRKRVRATELWVPTTDLRVAPSHPFYRRLNEIRRAGDFDAFVERTCQKFYAARMGRPSLAPGRVLPAAASCAASSGANTGEGYQEFLTTLAKASGIGTPTRADRARIDRRRTKKGSNDDWTHPHDPDAKITKMKDGRTHLAHKTEQAVDLDTGAVVAMTVQDADDGDTTTMQATLIAAAGASRNGAAR